MSYTAQDLIRHLGVRRHDLILLTVSPTGDATHLVCPALNSYAVDTQDRAHPWIYGSLTADILNRSAEIRGLSFDASTFTVTLAQPGMPAAITTGIYEMRRRYSHAIHLEAINSALALINLWWSRPVRDESLTTIAQTMRYTLPSDIEWLSIGDLEIYLETNTSTTISGFPYADATSWNPRVTREVSAAGVESYILQFGSEPPSGRKIRLLGSAGYSQLVRDDDVVSLDGAWGQMAFEWILGYASYQIDEWSLDNSVSDEFRRALAISGNRYEKQRQLLMAAAQGRRDLNISVPGVRDGMRPARTEGILSLYHVPGI